MELTDKQISDSYKEYTIRELKFDNERKHTGFLDIEFLNRESIVSNFIIYDSGKIAFDDWFPDGVYLELVEKIKNSKL